jgi:hypothetical protein
MDAAVLERPLVCVCVIGFINTFDSQSHDGPCSQVDHGMNPQQALDAGRFQVSEYPPNDEQLRVRGEIMGPGQYESRREISASSYYDQSHDLHPHPQLE